MSYGFNATLYQIRQGYRYLRGEPLPDDLAYSTAAQALVKDFGRDRVYAVLTAIGPDMDDAAALAAAKAADPGI